MSPVPASFSQRAPSYLVRQTCPLQLRHASTTASETAAAAASAAEVAAKPVKRSKSAFGKIAFRVLLGAGLVGGYLYVTDTRASAHRYVVVPLLRWLYPDAEEAHHVGVATLKRLYCWGLHPRERGHPDNDGLLATKVDHLPLSK